VTDRASVAAAIGEARGYPSRAFLICLAAYAFSQMDLALFGYAVPSMREEFGVSLKAMGWVISGSFVVGGLLLVWLALLTDRLGRKRMLGLSIVSSSVFIVLHALAPNVVVLALLRGLGIATGGLTYPVTGAIVVEEAPARLRGIFAGLLQTGYPLGWFLASLLAAPILAAYGWRPLFLVGLLSIPFVFVVARFLRESSRFRPAPTAAERVSLRELFTPAMRRRTCTLFIAQFMFVAAYGGTAILFPTYFVESRGFAIGNSAYLVGIGNLIGVLGYLLAALVGEFVITRRTTVVIWTLLGAAAFMWLLWGTSGYSDSVIAFGVMAMFFYGTAAVKFAYVAEIFPTRLRATGLAFCGSLAVTLGTAVGPLAISYSVEHIGWDRAFSLFGALPLFLAGLLYLLLKPVPSGIDVDTVQRALER
jgi:putative MFS transporter